MPPFAESQKCPTRDFREFGIVLANLEFQVHDKAIQWFPGRSVTIATSQHALQDSDQRRGVNNDHAGRPFSS